MNDDLTKKIDDLQKRLVAEAEQRDGRPFNETNRRLVIDALHYDGALRKKLTNEQYTKAYLLCNGFGDVDAKFAAEQCFDWSHVRDSSPIGFDRAAEYLRTLGL